MTKSFEFDGNWITKVELPKLSTLSNDKFYRPSVYDDLFNSLIMLTIEDEVSDTPDPSESQMNAINSLLNNEETIFQHIFDELKARYTNFFYDEEEEYFGELFPKLETIADLENVVGMKSIFVSILDKDSYAFIILFFSCSWDDEHGCTVVIHHDKVVQFNEGRDWDLESLVNNQEKYDDYMKATNYQIYAKGIYYYPHAKYNQLKPSQIESNSQYPFDLIYDGKNEQFIETIENKLYDINYGHERSFLSAVCTRNNEVLFDYVLSKGPINTFGSLKWATYFNNQHFIDRLLAYGVDINENHPRYGTPLKESVKEFLSNRSEETLSVLEEAIKYLVKMGADPYIKDSDGLNIFEYIPTRISQNTQRILDILTI